LNGWGILVDVLGSGRGYLVAAGCRKRDEMSVGGWGGRIVMFEYEFLE